MTGPDAPAPASYPPAPAPDLPPAPGRGDLVAALLPTASGNPGVDASAAVARTPAALPVVRSARAHFAALLASPEFPFASAEELGGNVERALPAPDVGTALAERSLARDLDRLREDLVRTRQAEDEWVASSALLATGLSVGYVLWLARGGVLVASLMSSLPAWAMVDPLPVLAQMKRRDGDADADADADANDPIERLFGKARQLVARGTARAMSAAPRRAAGTEPEPDARRVPPIEAKLSQEQPA